MGGGILTVDRPALFDGVICEPTAAANVHGNSPDDCVYLKQGGVVAEWSIGSGSGTPAATPQPDC